MERKTIILAGDDAARRRKCRTLSVVHDHINALSFGAGGMVPVESPLAFLTGCRNAAEGLSERLVLPDVSWAGEACDPKYHAVVWAVKMLAQPKHRMDDAWKMKKFWAAGVYGIGYDGDHESLAPLSGKEWFAYFGKSDSEEVFGNTAKGQGSKLWQRICREQYGNLAGRSGLKTKDFWVRYLPIHSAAQTEVEGHLIRLFRSVFNKESRWAGNLYQYGICSGFGKNGDAARGGNSLSGIEVAFPTDGLNPKEYQKNRRDKAQMLADIRRWLEETVPKNGADEAWFSSVIDSLA